MKSSLTLFLPALLSLLAVVAHGGCSRDLPELGEEIERVSSPNAEVFGVLSWRDEGWDSVFVVSMFQTGEPQNPYYPIVFEAENVRDIEIFWLTPRTLAISYAEASVYQFRNHWYILESEERLIEYDILLLPKHYFEDYIEKQLEKGDGK